MFKTLTVEDSKRKSSRSKADLFEVLVAIGLLNAYNLRKDELEKEKNNLENKISNFLDGETRIDEQHRRVNILVPVLVEKLNSEIAPIHGRVIAVSWIGRRWQEEETLSDLVIAFDSGFSIGISLKSTRQGKGTQKNIGYKKLKQLLSLNIDKELMGMWEEIRRDLSRKGGRLAKIAEGGQSKIKTAKYDFPIIQEIGKKYGNPVQELSIDKSIILFNGLSKNKKLVFLKEIFGIESTRPKLNATIEGKIPQLYWNKIIQGLLNGELVAKKLKSKSYYILAEGKPLVRLQASFTNGIGISAFCERAFLMIKI